MAKAIFTTRVDPSYDDLPEERYHFPRTYLRAAERAVGDWVIYYEPRRLTDAPGSTGGRQSYFATARLDRIEQDSAHSDHYYAFVSNYLDFDQAVPFREGAHYFESALRHDDGRTNLGPFQRAVRAVPDLEYDLILQAGYATILGEGGVANIETTDLGFDEEPATFERPIIERVIARPFRDAAFARQVKTAYQKTCAMTGICLINGGGRAEVQAAHIRPVAEDGPDSVRNGIALSSTIHWMFDRGLISLDDDYTILVAEDRVPDTVGRMLNEDRKLRLPSSRALVPHPQFLKYHRQSFKG
jgi:putative restriction endonuclease